VTDFSTSVVFSSSAYNSVSWSAGVVNIGKTLWVGSFATWSGSFTMSTNTFFYWNPASPNSISTTTTPSTAITDGGIILAVGIPNSDPLGWKAAIKTFWNGQNDLITADQIVANTITANKLATSLIYAWAITLSTNGNIKSGKVTYADTLTGFWLGNDSGTPKFRIGSTTNYFDWNGTNASIVGGLDTWLSGAKITLATSGLLTANDWAWNLLRIDPTNHQLSFQDGGLAAYLRVRNYSSVAYMETDANFRTSAALYSSWVSTGQIDASGTINANSLLSANYKMKLPVGTNLY
jgi:hypothetical protein